jgi:DNA invertase Pin-like site-specific DNA recombinase
VTEHDRRAAQYVRMSTEHQQYSTENQADVIAEYAHKRGLEVVTTFTDAGKSGLSIGGRNGLQSLIRLVESGGADFANILVYDVSRWGRFQDADESAYYEYICRRAGIKVHYCAEQFENDGSPVSTIVKGVKRAMAGEYSRELSAKVFKGQSKLIELGFRQGGTAGFGLRRQLVDQAGQPKQVLHFGEQKSLQTDRVVLVPGPADELSVVRRIYRLFVDERRHESQIADLLNRQGISNAAGGEWTRGTVHEVLTNEKYIGRNVYNRVSFKLKKRRVHNPPDMWIRNDDAFEAIVAEQDFFTVQGIIQARARRVSDEELLSRLKTLLEHRGKVSGVLIDEVEGMASSAVYRHRFGSLVRAYHLIGYTPERDFEFLEVNRRLRVLHPEVVGDVVRSLQAVGDQVERDDSTDLITVNRTFTVSVVLARFEKTPAGSPRWTIRLDHGLAPDLTVAVRLNATNADALDYYLLPSLDIRAERLRVAEDNGLCLDTYRLDSLDYLYGMAVQVHIEVAA